VPRRTILWLLTASALVLALQDDDQGVIAGRVVSAVTGAPVKDAVVTLRRSCQGAEPAVQQTNEAGRFAFTGLSQHCGRELTAEASGFAPATYGATRYSPGGTFQLAKNQQLTDIVLKLVAQSVIAGKVVDPDGAPVEGARVSLMKAGYAGGIQHFTEVASAQTLDNGEYRIPRVAAGQYVVKATIPPKLGVPHAPSETAPETGYAATYHPNVTDPSLAAPVKADMSQVDGVDIHLKSVRLFHIKGKLLGPASWSGQVRLLDRADQTIVARVTVRAPEYVFDIARVPPGSYQLYGVLLQTPTPAAAQPVEIMDRDVEGLVLRLAENEDLTGVIRPMFSAPPVDWRKISVTFDWVTTGMAPYTSTTYPIPIDENLRFRTHAYLESTVDVIGFRTVISKLPEGCYVASVRYGGRDVPAAGMDYSSGAEMEIVGGADGGRVDGSALGKDDKASANAVVALVPSDGKGSPYSTQADGQGLFHFSAVRPGDYKLLAWDDVSRDDLENPAFLKRFEGSGSAISLAPGGSAAASVRVMEP
jgi:hypothetical protein